MPARAAKVTQADVARVLTMDEAACELRVSRRWLQTFVIDKGIAHLAAGHKKLFDDRAMNEIREAMRCRSNSLPQKRAARKTTAYAERISEPALIAAQEALTAALQARNLRKSKAIMYFANHANRDRLHHGKSNIRQGFAF